MTYFKIRLTDNALNVFLILSLKRLRQSSSQVNFSPCYNGYPRKTTLTGSTILTNAWITLECHEITLQNSTWTKRRETAIDKPRCIDIVSTLCACLDGKHKEALRKIFEIYNTFKSILDSSNTDGLYTMANSSSFLSPYEILPIAPEN